MTTRSLWINRVDINPHTGYGRATDALVAALERADINIEPSAPTVINFCMPKDYVYHDYTIGYTPWESTNVPNSWREGLKKVDELWSTSTWSSGVLHAQTGRDVWTLPHGLDDTWMPTYHERPGTFIGDQRKFTFLHVGEPAIRKGGEYVLEAWYKEFKNKNCQLIYKTTGIPQARVKDNSGSIIFSPPMLTNGTVINKLYSDLEMWRLFTEVQCLVYPTRGEGFGFIPLEAMASGLPTILPADGGTADFSKYGIELHNMKWVESGEIEHPGQWMEHDVDEIIHYMKRVYANYSYHSQRAYAQAHAIRDAYSWDSVADKLIKRLDANI